MEKDYIKNLRQRVGHEPLILNFAGGILVNEKMRFYFKKDLILIHGDFQAGQWNLVSLRKKHVFANFWRKQA